MKTMMMVTVDVGPTMTSCVGSCRKIDLVKNFISTFMIQRMIASKTAEFGVVGYGSNVTKNYLNETQGGYEMVHEVAPMAKGSPYTIQMVEQELNCGDSAGDLIDGIVVGQDILIRVNNNKAYNRVMLLITDGETEVEGIDDLEVILEQMRMITNFGLYIALIGSVEKSSSNVKRENARFLKSISESVGVGRYREIDSIADFGQLLAQAPGLSTRPQLSKITLDLSTAVSIPCVMWGKLMKAGPPPMKKIVKTTPEFEQLVCAQMVIATDSAATAGYRGSSGGGDGGYSLAGVGHGASQTALLGTLVRKAPLDLEIASALASSGSVVKRDSRYLDPDDPEVELRVEDRLKGYRYGSQYVPIAPEEEEMFKIPGPAGITLIGFMKHDNVPQHHFLESPLIVQGAVGNEAAQQCMYALCTALAETGTLALARCVKRQNADPFLCALLPASGYHVQGSAMGTGTGDNALHSLVLHRLPTREDVRDFPFPSLLKYSPDAEAAAAQGLPPLAVDPVRQQQLHEMDRFVQSLTIIGISSPSPSSSSSSSSSSQKQRECSSVLTPPNPFLQAIYHALYATIVGQPIGPDVTSARAGTGAGVVGSSGAGLIRALGGIEAVDAAHAAFSAVLARFPLTRTERGKGRKKRKVYWSELRFLPSDGDDGLGGNAQTSKSSQVHPGFGEDSNLSASSSSSAAAAATSVKRIRAEVAAEGDGQSAMQIMLDEHVEIVAPDLTVASPTPVEDFEAVLSFAVSQLPTSTTTAIAAAPVTACASRIGTVTSAQEYSVSASHLAAAGVTIVGAASMVGLTVDEAIGRAMRTMGRVVKYNVEIGSAPRYLSMALRCLEAMRAAAVRFPAHVALFNDFMINSLKPTNKPGDTSSSMEEIDFWSHVVAAGITLVTDEELQSGPSGIASTGTGTGAKRVSSAGTNI